MAGGWLAGFPAANRLAGFCVSSRHLIKVPNPRYHVSVATQPAYRICRPLALTDSECLDYSGTILVLTVLALNSNEGQSHFTTPIVACLCLVLGPHHSTSHSDFSRLVLFSLRDEGSGCVVGVDVVDCLRGDRADV